jgi:hypothetical protein
VGKQDGQAKVLSGVQAVQVGNGNKRRGDEMTKAQGVSGYEAKITVKEAAAFLDGHVNYRKLSKRRVDAYARVMSRGQWGMSILIFGGDGMLLDGQTRLNAQIKAGVDLAYFVVTNWPESDAVALDNNQARTRAQVGVAERGIKSANKVLAVLAMIDDPFRRELRLNKEMVELYDECGHIAEDVIKLLRAPLGGAIHAAAFARAIWLMPHKEQDILDCMSKLMNMEFAEDRMRGMKMYFRIATLKHGEGGTTRRAMYKKCARALVAYLDGEPISKLIEPKGDPIIEAAKTA